MSDDDRARWSVAVAAAAATFVASYAIQRLYAAWSGGPDGAVVLDTAFVPYRWRCGLALVQGGMVGMVLGPVLGPETAAFLLRTVPVWVTAVVALAAIAMLAVP